LSLREIAAEHHVSHTAIRKRAARGGWQRDLVAKIRARADVLVSRAEVSREVSTESGITGAATESGVASAAIVESNAPSIAQIRWQRRRDIARARTLAISLLDDLQAISASVPLIEPAAVVAKNLEIGPKEVDQRVAAVRKAFDLRSKAGMLKSLTDTLAKLIAMERDAYGLDSDPDTKEVAAMPAL
jgi:hypothetical protein